MTDTSLVPVVILAGGRGSRFDHESQVVPKPMIEVCGKPILQHIIDSFVCQGFREFIVPTGYLHHLIDSHFMRGSSIIGPFSYDFGYYGVTTRDTGNDAHTGLRLWNVRDLIGNRPFVLTYGDGLSDVNMEALLAQHSRTGAMVTVTAVRPPSRFGVIEFTNARGGDEYTLVESFSEKAETGWINGGFMAVEPEFIEQYIEGEFELESVALNELAACSELHAYRHEGFWMCMDTRRDRDAIELAVKRFGHLPWLR